MAECRVSRPSQNHELPPEVPPDIGGEMSRVDKKGKDLNVREDHMTNSYTHTMYGGKRSEHTTGTNRPEYTVRGPDQTSKKYESNSAGLRKNGAAVGTGQNKGHTQISYERAWEKVGSEQGLPTTTLSDLGLACRVKTRSEVGTSYTKRQIQNLLLGFWVLGSRSHKWKSRRSETWLLPRV